MHDLGESDILPALYGHCVTIYRMLHREAEDVDFEGDTVRVFEGSTTNVFNRAHLSTPYYSHVMKRLQNMGCVRQIRRGGGSSMSRWLIITEPTPEAWAQAAEMSRVTARSGKVVQLEQKVRDLQRQFVEMKAVLDLLVKTVGQKESS